MKEQMRMSIKFFVVVVVNYILGNSPIGQMDLDIMAHVWNYNCMIWLKKKKKPKNNKKTTQHFLGK